MSSMTSQINGVSSVWLTICSGADHRNHKSSVSLEFLKGIHRWLMDSPHKGPVMRRIFPFDDVIMQFCHNDVIKWKDFPRYWPFAQGIHRSPVNSSDKGQWRGALMFSLIYAWANGWINYRYASDLRRHGANYNVIAMLLHNIGSASRSRDFTRFGPGGSTLSRFPCKTPIGKVGTSQYTFVTRKLA